MAAGSIVVDLLMRTGSFETDTQRAGKSLKKLESEAAAVGKGLGLAFVGASAAIVGLAKASIDSLDALNDFSDATGSSVENLSALERVAKLNGQTLEDVGGIVIKFNAALKEADGKNGISQALQGIGLDAQKLRQLDPAEALRQVAVALSTFADNGTKARYVQELFGKSIREAGPFLKDLAEQGKLVATVTKQQTEAAEAFNKEIFALQTYTSDAARSLVSVFVPALNSTIKWLKEGTAAGTTYYGALARIAKEAGDQVIASARMNETEADRQATITRLTALLANENLEVERRIRLENQLAQVKARSYSAFTDKAGGGRGFTNPELLKPSLAELPNKPTKDKAPKKERDDFASLMKQATEMRALAEASLLGEEKLNAAQQLAARIAADYTKGLVDLTEAQLQAIDVELKAADASQRGTELRERETRATQEAAQAFEQQYLAMVQVRDSFLDEATASNEALAAFGKTRAEIEELSIAKIRASAASLEHRAVLREERDELDPIAQLYREQAAAIRATARARDELNRKEQQLDTDPLTGATQAVKDYLAEVKNAGRGTYDLIRGTIRGLEDTLTAAFTGGDVKGAFKSLIDNILAEATRLYVVKPLLASIFGGAGSGGVDYAKLLSSIGSFFGGSTATPAASGASPYVYPGSYATGIQSVPRDGYAFLHKDETVVPKAYDPAGGRRGELKVVVNAPPGTKVDRQQERETPDGRELEVFLSMAEQRVAGNLGRGRGPVAGALKSRGVGLSGAIPRRT